MADYTLYSTVNTAVGNPSGAGPTIYAKTSADTDLVSIIDVTEMANSKIASELGTDTIHVYADGSIYDETTSKFITGFTNPGLRPFIDAFRTS